jgi:Family of unknown function (DUF6615)
MYSPPANILCKTFCDQATWTWNSLQSGIQTGILLDEETITDINLLEIQKRHPLEARTHKYYPPIEGAISGADWDWWFGSKTGWLGLRIQAKKLNHKTLRYDKLAHATKKHGLQVDLLLRSAAKSNLIPMYCFYNYWNVQIPIPWNCGTYPQTQELLGCTIASANQVRKLISANDRSLQSVMKKSLPWSCLVCCQGYALKAGLTARVSSVLQKFYRINPELIRVTEEPPSYISDLLVGEFREQWKSEVSNVLIVTEGIL